MQKWLTKIDFREVALVLVLGLFVIATRTIWQLGPNIELISSLVVFSAAFYKQKWLRLLGPISVIVISDLVLGNSAIFLFTWSGFMAGLLMSLQLRSIKQKDTKDAILSPIEFIGSGIANVLFFYLWTNLGVVLVSGMYPLSIFGLSQSYINALPFLGNQLLSAVVGGMGFYLLYRSLYYLRDSKFIPAQELKLAAQAK